MAIAITLRDYLAEHGAHYDVVSHARSHNSIQSAKLAHIPPDCLAKPVILEDDGGDYLMAVIPCSHHVRLGALSKELHRTLRLATEYELADLFKDCEVGAVPPLGGAYGVEMIVDEALAQQSDIYFEAGDHEELIHMPGREFMTMLAGARRGQFSRRVSGPSVRLREPLASPDDELGYSNT